ncbi:MAG: DUF721 domain-containing protein [Bacteroidota bacterium]
MKKHNDQPIKDILKQLIQQNKWGDKVNEKRLLQCWEEMLGKMIAKYTKTINLRNKKLYIEVESAPLKNELIYSRQKMIELINSRFGEGIVEEIIIR